MPNFDSAGAGFSRGFAAGRTIKQNKKALQLQERQAQQQAAQKMRETFAKAREQALQGFTTASEAAKEAAAAGAGDDAINQLRVVAAASLGSYASSVQQLRARAIASGADEQVLNSLPDPVAFVKQNMPLFDSAVQVGRSQTAEALGQKQADQNAAMVAQLAKNLGISEEQVAQAAGLTPAPGPAQKALVDGKPAFVQQQGDQLVPLTGATPMPSGMNISVGPDGTITLATGDQIAKPTTATANDLQESVVNSNDGLARLFGIQAGFKPEFLTFAGKIKGGISAIKEKAGIDLGPGEQKFLEEYTTFTRDAVNNMNLYIKAITGAQMAVAEAERMRPGIPDPQHDSPTEFKSKMEATIRELALTRARSLHVLRLGLDQKPWEVVSLEGMSNLIDARVEELTKTLGSREAALAQAAKEFGL